MSKAVKRLMVDELAERLQGVDSLLVASTMGLKAEEAVQFRAALREKGVRALVVKNVMCARAFQRNELGYAEPLLDGPTTLIYGGETVVDAAKVLADQASEFDVVKIRGGATGGTLLSAEDVVALSKLPSREELVSSVVGALLSGTQGVVGALMAPAQEVAGQLDQLAERQEQKEAA